jgi:EAL domain-containing protein (putative c-di-GMP-specific phosphodiesterase class I)
VHVSLDDFGTGYSSLGYLRRLPLDGVKIDRSLTPAADDHVGIGLVQGVIHLCHALGLEIVAEGVEEDAQEQLLARLGCDRLQGHHIGRPHRGDEAPELRAGRT